MQGRQQPSVSGAHGAATTLRPRVGIFSLSACPSAPTFLLNVSFRSPRAPVYLQTPIVHMLASASPTVCSCRRGFLLYACLVDASSHGRPRPDLVKSRLLLAFRCAWYTLFLPAVLFCLLATHRSAFCLRRTAFISCTLASRAARPRCIHSDISGHSAVPVSISRFYDEAFCHDSVRDFFPQCSVRVFSATDCVV